jgi:hypothetical protein
MDSDASRWQPEDTPRLIRAFLGRLCDVLDVGAPVSSDDFVLGDTTQYRAICAALEATMARVDRWILGQSVEATLRQKQRATVRVLGESAQRLAWVARHRRRHALCVSDAFAAACAQRPEALLDYDQLYCSPDSTERRSQAILSRLPQEGRVLCLGDDDLTSLALSAASSARVDVIEFDTRLLRFIKERNQEMACYPFNLFLEGLPADMQGQYDAVVLDPPWDHYHAGCFLNQAVLAMRDVPDARMYMAFCPLNIAWLERKARPFWRRFSAMGLECHSIQPALHVYPLDGTEFMELLLQFCPPCPDEPLLEALRSLPFGFSDLYVFGRAPGARISWWRRWWHMSREPAAPLAFEL